MKHRYSLTIFILFISIGFAYSEDWMKKYDDLQDKTTAELRLLRNEIPARHGYIFKSQDLKEYFSKQQWYAPSVQYSDKMLTQDEKEIVKKINELERNGAKKHATAVTDSIKSGEQGNNLIGRVDLNGDGVPDDVYFIGSNLIVNDIYKTIKHHTYFLNDASSECRLVDIDTKDKYKEIAIASAGEGDGDDENVDTENYITRFYYYDGKEITDMGSIGGLLSYGRIKIDGTGKLIGRERAAILGDWFIYKEYRLDRNHKIVWGFI